MTKADFVRVRKAWQRYDKATAYNNPAFDPAKLADARSAYLQLLESLGVNTVGMLAGNCGA